MNVPENTSSSGTKRTELAAVVVFQAREGGRCPQAGRGRNPPELTEALVPNYRAYYAGGIFGGYVTH